MKHLRITNVMIFGTLAVLAQSTQRFGFDTAFDVVAQEAPTFEAASVKPTDPRRNGSTFNFAPGQLQIGGGTLRQIMEMAYDLRTFQILGGPAWVDADRYDISAMNDAALKDLSREERTKGMQRRLQTLLADRFQVKVHRETREMTEYELVVAKSGSKLKESDPGVGNGISANCGVLKGTRTTISNLAVTLSRQLGRPVLDRTGLTERYDFRTEIYAGRRLWVAPARRRSTGRRLQRQSIDLRCDPRANGIEIGVDQGSGGGDRSRSGGEAGTELDYRTILLAACSAEEYKTVAQCETETGLGYKVPNGAIFTTIGDLARFASFPMGQGPESVLKLATLESFQMHCASEPRIDRGLRASG